MRRRRTAAFAVRAVGLVGVVERDECVARDGGGDDVRSLSMVAFAERRDLPPVAPTVVLNGVGEATVRRPRHQQRAALLLLLPAAVRQVTGGRQADDEQKRQQPPHGEGLYADSSAESEIFERVRRQIV